MAKVGDIVRFLNSVGGGRIVRIDGNLAYVDEDGFETPVLLKECVVVSEGATHVPPPAPRFSPAGKSQPTAKNPDKAPEARVPAPEETFVVEETPGGEKLNIVLAYEAADLKRLSTTSYDAYLVNDSNYYLYFTYLTRADGEEMWTTRHAGMVEPGIQLLLGEVERDTIGEMSRVAIQYVAFKKDKPFAAKPPVWVEQRLDNTKFFKLHCFKPNQYFDTPVIAVDIVTDDKPCSPVEVDASRLEKAMRQKAAADRPARRQARERGSHKPGEPLVVDLHIAELVDSTAGLSSSDMLNLQIDTFCKVMDANLGNHGKKIVFIHGKGDGVLRRALLKELAHRYKAHDAQDASFREYGFGATQVTIR